MLYLTVEDIVPNSIIEKNKINGSREILIEEAKKYGEEVAEHLKKRGYYTIVKLNSSLTESFETKYSEYFNKYYEKESYGYQLAQDKEIKDLIPIFRESIAEEVRDSFSNEEVIKNSFPQKANRKVLTLVKNEK